MVVFPALCSAVPGLSTASRAGPLCFRPGAPRGMSRLNSSREDANRGGQRPRTNSDLPGAPVKRLFPHQARFISLAGNP